MSITLYHYTDKESADSIDDSKIMYKSTDTIADARWGIGVYFTDMKPDDFTADELLTITGYRLYHLGLNES